MKGAGQPALVLREDFGPSKSRSILGNMQPESVFLVLM
jgi:hypothetical protein